jgi:sec-independent protein translocase protein TatA
MGKLSMVELIVILLLVLLLFGGSRLPQAGAGLGKAIRNFKDAMAGRDEQEPDGGRKAGGDPDGGKARPR